MRGRVRRLAAPSTIQGFGDRRTTADGAHVLVKGRAQHLAGRLAWPAPSERRGQSRGGSGAGRGGHTYLEKEVGLAGRRRHEVVRQPAILGTRCSHRGRQATLDSRGPGGCRRRRRGAARAVPALLQRQARRAAIYSRCTRLFAYIRRQVLTRRWRRPVKWDVWKLRCPQLCSAAERRSAAVCGAQAGPGGAADNSPEVLWWRWDRAGIEGGARRWGRDTGSVRWAACGCQQL